MMQHPGCSAETLSDIREGQRDRRQSYIPTGNEHPRCRGFRQTDQRGGQEESKGNVERVRVERSAECRRTAAPPGQVDRRDSVGQAGHGGQDQAAQNDVRDVKVRRPRTMRPVPWRHWPATTTTNPQPATAASTGVPRRGWIASSSSLSSSTTAAVIQTCSGSGAQTSPRIRSCAPRRTTYGMRTQTTRTNPVRGRECSSDAEQTADADQHRGDSTKDDHLAMEPDSARHDSTQPEQGRQVEDVGT